jgi:hypothetical protein
MKRFVSLQFLILRHSVELLGWGISQSQGRYEYKHRKNIHASRGIRTDGPSVRAGEDSKHKIYFITVLH